MRKSRFKIVFSLFFVMVILGIFTVSATLPQIIKDKNNFKVSFSTKPFDFSIETEKYIFYINKKATKEIKKGTEQIIKSIMSKISKNTLPLYDTYDNVTLQFNEHIFKVDSLIKDLAIKGHNVFRNIK